MSTFKLSMYPELPPGYKWIIFVGEPAVFKKGDKTWVMITGTLDDWLVSWFNPDHPEYSGERDSQHDETETYPSAYDAACSIAGKLWLGMGFHDVG